MYTDARAKPLFNSQKLFFVMFLSAAAVDVVGNVASGLMWT